MLGECCQRLGQELQQGKWTPLKAFRVCVGVNYLLKMLAKAFSCNWGVYAIKMLPKFCLMFATWCGAALCKTEVDSQEVLPSQEQEIYSD